MAVNARECANGCGFWGSPDNLGLCSACARKQLNGGTRTHTASAPGWRCRMARPHSDGDQQLAALGPRQLKAVITAAGLSHDDCTTVGELRARAGQAAAAAAAASPGRLETTTRTLAGLRCVIKAPPGCVGGEGRVDLAVLLMHGWTGSVVDVQPVVDAVAAHRSLRGLNVVFVLPQARGRSWGAVPCLPCPRR